MKPPSEFQIDKLMHVYDPQKAHDYYIRNRKLKGRKGGGLSDIATRAVGSADPRSGKSRKQIHQDARARQRKMLSEQVHNLERKLQQLDALIKKKEHDEASVNRKSKAKKERAAKEKDKPKTAAEKAQAERDNKKYRDKHKQELKNKAKDANKSGGSSTSAKKSSPGANASVAQLKTLATKVRGQLAVAKQKLAAL